MSREHEDQRLLRELEEALGADTTSLYRAFLEESKARFRAARAPAGTRPVPPPASAHPAPPIPRPSSVGPAQVTGDALLHRSLTAEPVGAEIPPRSLAWLESMRLPQPPRTGFDLAPGGGLVAFFVSPDPAARWVVEAEECAQVVVELHGPRLCLRLCGTGSYFRGHVRLDDADGTLARTRPFSLGSAAR
jgi:hypothetical protein